MNSAAAETPTIQMLKVLRPKLPIEHAPGTMEAIAIWMIMVVAFYKTVWYHAHMRISPSYPVKRILALVPRSGVLACLPKISEERSRRLGRSADPSAQDFFRSDVAG
jgi:hypothetical protein